MNSLKVSINTKDALNLSQTIDLARIIWFVLWEWKIILPYAIVSRYCLEIEAVVDLFPLDYLIDLSKVNTIAERTIKNVSHLMYLPLTWQ